MQSVLSQESQGNVREFCERFCVETLINVKFHVKFHYAIGEHLIIPQVDTLNTAIKIQVTPTFQLLAKVIFSVIRLLGMITRLLYEVLSPILNIQIHCKESPRKKQTLGQQSVRDHGPLVW